MDGQLRTKDDQVLPELGKVRFNFLQSNSSKQAHRGDDRPSGYIGSECVSYFCVTVFWQIGSYRYTVLALKEVYAEPLVGEETGCERRISSSGEKYQYVNWMFFHGFVPQKRYRIQHTRNAYAGAALPVLVQLCPRL
jgi:hypothetical protein